MPIERAVFHASAWEVYWSAPHTVIIEPPPVLVVDSAIFSAEGSLDVAEPGVGRFSTTGTLRASGSGTVTPPPPVLTPVAAFTAVQQKPSTTGAFDGSGSHETNGSIVSWAWDFGDASAAVTTPSPTTTHPYARAGTYSVTLTVTDASGQRAQSTLSVQVTVASSPLAKFVTTKSGMGVSVNASGSSSPNGSITSYAWNFGDGATASGVTSSHTFAGGGTYAVNLTVTDSVGMTANSSQSITFPSLPVAAFTVATSGLGATVDASSTVAPNPISSYDWNWNETVSTTSTTDAYTYSYGAVSKTVTVDPSQVYVIQCVVRSNDTGEYYITQRDPASGTEKYESTQISRNDATGKLLDTSKFVEAGHGTSIALQYISGKVYIWMAWQKAASGGLEEDLVRFPYPAPGTYTRASPPPGMQVMYKGTGSKMDVQFDWLYNRAIVRTNAGSGTTATNTFQQVNLTDFVAGKMTVYHTVGPLDVAAPPTIQGFCTSRDVMFISWGIRYTRPSATAPLNDPNDPPVIKQYRWSDGGVVSTYNTGVWGKNSSGTYKNDTYEPQSCTIYVTSAGFPHVLFGFLTGSGGSATSTAYNYDIFQIPLNTVTTTSTTTSTGPVPHSSGKTASHTFAKAGTYQVALTVKDTVGNTDGQTNAVTVNTVANKPPTAAFTFTVGTGTNWNHVDFDASASTDSDGVIDRYDWDFQQSNVTLTTPTAKGYVYTTGGTYTVKLTVTDSSGASASITHAVTVTDPTVVTPTNQPPVASYKFTVSPTIWNRVDFDATASTDSDGTIVRYDWDFGEVLDTPPPPPPPPPPPSSGDNGLGINNGAQPTGSGYLPIDLNGSDIGTQATAAGANYLSLPPGTIQKLKPWTVNSTGAAVVTGGLGIIGSGSAKTTISQVPNSSSGASVVTNGTNADFLIVSNVAGAVFQDFTLLGTAQSVANHHGFQVSGDNTVFRRLKLVQAGVGNDKAPPGETFGLSVYNANGVVVEDVEIDGQGVGASGFATNGSATGKTIGDYTVNRLYTHDNWWSGGIALWQQRGNAVFNDCTFDNCRCFWNVERCAGSVILNRPRIGSLKSAGPELLGIFCETGTTFTTAAEAAAFRFEIHDPRNLDGSVYDPAVRGKLNVRYGDPGTGGPCLYGRNNFKAYNASGGDISAAFFNALGTPAN